MVMKKIKANIVDVVKKRIFPAEMVLSGGKIAAFQRVDRGEGLDYLIPGLVDSHIHIESSMLTPGRFAEIAVKHGTVATVSDPHEIANVLGVDGVKFMMENAEKVPLKFYFGAPSCVPATEFETSGAILNSIQVKGLLENDRVKYLSEMMNFPGVINEDKEVLKKLYYARKFNKPIDGHAPGLTGDSLKKYIAAGVKTDHECSTIAEAREKLKAGMYIQIREGSAARNFDVLIPLIDDYPDKIMLCSDDLHPDQLLHSHINGLLQRGVKLDKNVFDLLRAATYTPKKFYNLNIGLLQPGDPADFVRINNLKELEVRQTYIEGELVYDQSGTKFSAYKSEEPNVFIENKIQEKDLKVPDEGKAVKVIQVHDGELWTNCIKANPNSIQGFLESDVEKDILKLVVQNRYKQEKPALGFINNFGLKYGGMISTIAHDSHNIICIATSDEIIINLVEWINNNKGGIAFSDGEKIYGLPLPVAGILSDEDPYEVAHKYNELEEMAKNAGSELKSPFMSLSFMALLVIPELKLSNKGLFDGSKFQFTDLYV